MLLRLFDLPQRNSNRIPSNFTTGQESWLNSSTSVAISGELRFPASQAKLMRASFCAARLCSSEAANACRSG